MKAGMRNFRGKENAVFGDLAMQESGDVVLKKTVPSRGYRNSACVTGGFDGDWGNEKDRE